MKSVIYCGDSAKEISNFDSKARQRILRFLDMLRIGLELHPKDLKYMGIIGNGVYELRVKTIRQYRVFYVAKFADAIYILHAFVKKTQKTSKRDIELGIQRYKTVVNYFKGTKK